MRIETTIEGLDQLLSLLSPEELEKRTKVAMQLSLDILHEAVILGTPIDTTGTVRRLTRATEGTPIDFTGVIASPDEYFYNLEFGRRIGATMPPHAPLEAWASRHGIEGRSAVFLIRRAISRRGLPALMIMHKAVEQNETQITGIWERTFSDLGIEVE